MKDREYEQILVDLDEKRRKLKRLTRVLICIYCGMMLCFLAMGIGNFIMGLAGTLFAMAIFRWGLGRWTSPMEIWRDAFKEEGKKNG
jgi:hypothetical protein